MPKGFKARMEEYYRLVAKYGNELVPAKDVYPMFGEVSALERSDFIQTKRGFFVRPISDDIAHVIKLQATKGLGYTVLWGVSLSYLPHRVGARPLFHRTSKAARFDLFEDPFEYFEERRIYKGWKGRALAENGLGPVYLRKTMVEMWWTLANEILEWFESTNDFHGVLGRARNQLERKWFGAGHWPHPRLVEAFTLAKLGQRDDALASFSKFSSLCCRETDLVGGYQATLNGLLAV